MTKYKGLLRTVQHLSDYQMNGRVGRRPVSFHAGFPGRRGFAGTIPRVMPKSRPIAASLTVQGRG